ncbi:hypothetical protein [Paractinoplanes toevensis]|uniref:Uncharacterized protein n=1 Tax=Paractinoplanes toevensis TaxID=571911 RepID=A0A919VYB3_9ACTN|nr:hypothetical protein [Actinoplanes toevensis]GIM88817.1 hypothetical protein Ato02nite_006100 [Actinoplanes toevensis]
MSYTYDTHDDTAGFDTLTDAQRMLGRDVNERARNGEAGGDRRLILKDIRSAPAADKAALAEIWGGPGAGKEFLR